MPLSPKLISWHQASICFCHFGGPSAHLIIIGGGTENVNSLNDSWISCCAYNNRQFHVAFACFFLTVHIHIVYQAYFFISTYQFYIYILLLINSFQFYWRGTGITLLLIALRKRLRNLRPLIGRKPWNSIRVYAIFTFLSNVLFVPVKMDDSPSLLWNLHYSLSDSSCI